MIQQSTAWWYNKIQHDDTAKYTSWYFRNIQHGDITQCFLHIPAIFCLLAALHKAVNFIYQFIYLLSDVTRSSDNINKTYTSKSQLSVVAFFSHSLQSLLLMLTNVLFQNQCLQNEKNDQNQSLSLNGYFFGCNRRSTKRFDDSIKKL